MSRIDPDWQVMIGDWNTATKKIKQRLKELEFVLGTGELSRKYITIANESERMAFLFEHFGKRALDVRADRQEMQSKILSLRMRVDK